MSGGGLIRALNRQRLNGSSAHRRSQCFATCMRSFTAIIRIPFEAVAFRGICFGWSAGRNCLRLSLLRRFRPVHSYLVRLDVRHVCARRRTSRSSATEVVNRQSLKAAFLRLTL